MKTSTLLHASLGSLTVVAFLLAPAALVAFAATEELAWLRTSYWITGAGVITGIAAVLCGAVLWVLVPPLAEKGTIWYTGACLSVLSIESAAWVGLGGWNGVPATANRDITVAMIAQFMGATLVLATAWLGWSIAAGPHAAVSPALAPDERFREAAPRRHAA